MKKLLASVNIRRTSQFFLLEWKGYVLPLGLYTNCLLPYNKLSQNCALKQHTHMYYLATLMSLSICVSQVALNAGTESPAGSPGKDWLPSSLAVDRIHNGGWPLAPLNCLPHGPFEHGSLSHQSMQAKKAIQRVCLSEGSHKLLKVITEATIPHTTG